MADPGPTANFRQILLYRPGALGDLVAIIPFLTKLRQTYPAARIHLLCSASWQWIGQTLAEETYSVEDPRLLPLFSGGRANHFPSPSGGFDMAYLFLQNRDSLFEQGVLQFARAVRWIQTRPSPELRHCRPTPKSEEINIRQFLHDQEFDGPMPIPVLRLPDFTEGRPSFMPATTDPGKGLQEGQVLRGSVSSPFDSGTFASKSLLCIHPGSGSPAKNWPLENFLEIARFWRMRGRRVVWTLGPADGDLKDVLCRQLSAEERLSAKGDRICADLTLPQLCALYAQPEILWLCNDSGPAHLAAALGAHGVAIFGASDATLWAPQGMGRIRILGKRDAFPAVEEVKAALASLAKFN